MVQLGLFSVLKKVAVKKAEICCAHGRERRKEGAFATPHASASKITQVLLLIASIHHPSSAVQSC